MWNKRIKNNPNGMATVAKSDHFHDLERGIRTNPLALGQNFVSSINRELQNSKAAVNTCLLVLNLKTSTILSSPK